MVEQAYVRFRVPPGRSGTKIHSFQEFYGYDSDNQGAGETNAKNRFNHIHLALRSGEENQEPDKAEEFSDTIWPWVISGAMLAIMVMVIIIHGG